MTTELPDFPGRLFITKQSELDTVRGYHVSDSVMSLELFGEPDSEGNYTLDNVRWWHLAQSPWPDSPVEAGDPCPTVLENFRYGDIDYTNHSRIPPGTTKKYFKSLDELDAKRIEHSICCNTCGFHIYVDVHFLDTQKEASVASA